MAAAHPADLAATDPYLAEIRQVFYNFQIAHFNERVYAEFLDRAERKYRWTQVTIAVLTVIAAAGFMIPVALDDSQMILWVHRLNFIAAVLSFIAFVASVIAPLFGWEKTIDELTLRVDAWHFAENQLEPAVRFLRHNAKGKRDAEVAVQFANSAYAQANNLPQVGKEEKELFERIKKEVEAAFPPDYPWTAL